MRLAKTATEEEVNIPQQTNTGYVTHRETQNVMASCVSAGSSQYKRGERELVCARSHRAAALRHDPQDGHREGHQRRGPREGC